MAGYAALPTKSPGDLLTSALWNTYLQGNADSGFLRMLADSTLGGSQSSVTFSSIPSTFAHLLLVVTARGDTAATTVGLLARFNGDSGSDYATETAQANSTSTMTGSETASSTSFAAGLIAAASATANHVGGAAIFIPGYAGSTFFKQILALTATTTGLTTGNMWTSVRGGTWAGTAAITQIQLLPSAGNFITGSRFTLYGLPH